MTSITVIGAGIFGLAAGYEIARRGHPVQVIEARGIGAGSSGGTVGALAPHAPDSWNRKKQVQFDSLLAARDFWDGVAQTGGCDPGYARNGRVQAVARGDLDRLRQRIEGAERNWQGQARMWLTQTRPVGDLVPDSPDGWWLQDDLSARLSPRLACQALAAAIRAQRGEIICGAAAHPADVPAPAIWATGAEGLAMLTDDLARKQGQGVKGQSASLGFAAPDAPQVYAEGLHVVPHADGTVGVGSTSENEYTHDRVDAQLDDVIARARATCPALADAPVLERWAGIRPRARSRAPLLGPWPGRAGQFVLNGGFKIGFGMAPVLAGMIADLAIDGQDRIPPEFRS
ncbi:NAD(P)/FAD-dependent oxidoreductase [Paracoccus jeotgali]|uniref:NAD(P)/FAD-dependent oxidoreductase n=1 Tax=Paracoccus jeotgali TaxID=2065379 RepID=UPI0028AAACB6|nr:FAD-dependent oxidoreductase [Paracoccus jeotgali]